MKNKILQAKHEQGRVLLSCLFLNILYLVIMLIVFEPFISSDDYAQTNTLYGAWGGEYDYQCIYSSWIYGKIVVFFLKLFPHVAWYTILFYTWCFLAFWLFTSYLLRQHPTWTIFLFINVFLLYFTYEAYVCVQFTKCSAIVGVIGTFFILQKKSALWEKIAGIVLVVLCCIIRYDNYTLVSYGSLVLITLLILKERSIRTYRASILCILFLMALCSAMIPRITLYSSDENREVWEKYYEWNDARIAVIDYETPDYDTNIEFYKDLGISKNDLYIWKNQNYDRMALSAEKGKAIQRTQKREQNLLKKVFDISNITGFFKEYPLFFLKTDVFYCYLILILLCIFFYSQKGELVVAVGISLGMLLLFSYYLFINNKYGLHRVDVGLVLFSIIIFLLFSNLDALDANWEVNEKNKMFEFLHVFRFSSGRLKHTAVGAGDITFF